MTTTIQNESQTNGRFPQRFKPGNPGGPGRPKGSIDFRSELLKSLRVVEKRKRQSVCVRAWEMAWQDETMMAALLRKLLPDLSHQTGQLPTTINVLFSHRTDAMMARPIPDDVPGEPHT